MLYREHLHTCQHSHECLNFYSPLMDNAQTYSKFRDVLRGSGGAGQYVGLPAIPVCPGIRRLPKHGTLRFKPWKILDKPGRVGHLSSICNNTGEVEYCQLFIKHWMQSGPGGKLQKGNKLRTNSLGSECQPAPDIK